MEKNAEIKSLFLKEASDHIDAIKDIECQVNIKNALLNDAIMHIDSVEKGLTSVASLEKCAMAAQMGSSYYRLASNVEVTEFPEEEHNKIRQTKQKIMEDFAPLLIQRIKTQGKWVKIDLSEVLEGSTPFYIRLQFKKHILPVENKEQIVNELEQMAPGFSELVEQLEELDLAPLPYYNIQCEKSYRDPAIQLTQKMLSELAAPVSTGWTGNFVTQQPNLKNYWQRMNMEMEKDPKKFPPLYRTIGASTYSTALKWPAEKIDEIPDMTTLLQGVYFAEINENNSLYSASPQDQKEKKAQWSAFVLSQMLPNAEKVSPNDEDKAKILAQQKAQVVAERVWKVFGEIPPEKRDIKASVGRGKLETPYNQFHQNDIRMLLKFLKVPQIRFTSTPRARPNGLDMGHIYPPVNFNAESNSYGLDYIRGNCGLKQLKLNLPKYMALSKGDSVKRINDIYSRLIQSQDHPIMQSHTGADNLLFLFNNLSNMETESFDPGYDAKIQGQYGPNNSKAILNFVRGLVGSIKATKKDSEALNSGPELLMTLMKPGENGVSFGYQLAKILDVLQYTILKNLPDPVYKVRARNYATGGVSGELMLAVEYAYSVVPNRDIAGGKAENIRALEQAPRPMSGVSPEMVRKTHHYQRFEGTEFPQMEKTPVSVEQGDAKLAPHVAYIVTHKTGGTHSRPQKGKNFYTLESALAYFQGLYPQAEGAMETLQQKLYLIGLRMDLATKEIRSIVEEAIKLKQAEINAVLGTDIMSETGQNMDESLSELKEEVSSIKEEVQEYDPNYIEDDEEFAKGLEYDQALIKELGKGIPQAEKIAVQLLATGNEKVVEFLHDKGIKGQKLVDNYEQTFGGQGSVSHYADWIKSLDSFYQWQLDKGYAGEETSPEEETPYADAKAALPFLIDGNTDAEAILYKLLSNGFTETIKYLKQLGIKGKDLVYYYNDPKYGNGNLKQFMFVIDKAIQSHKKEDEIFGKKPQDTYTQFTKNYFKKLTTEEQNYVKLLGHGVHFAEVMVELLIKIKEVSVLEFLRFSNIKGSNLVELYKSSKVSDIKDFAAAVKHLPQYNSWLKQEINKEQQGYPEKQITEQAPKTEKPIDQYQFFKPEEPEKNAENRISKLIKLADKFDSQGYIHISNNIDLLLAKIKD